MAAFSGLSLTHGASALAVGRRKLVVGLAAVVLGGGIWSMHFVAMLGLQLPIAFYYDALFTLASALIAILVVGAALLVLHFVPRRRSTLVAAGSLMGLGIVAMHYVGMLGMELCRPVFAPLGVAVAFIAAMALSILAIFVAYGARTRGNILLGTACFGLSVFAVHFIAMWGTGFEPLDTVTSAGPALSNEVLAVGVIVAAFAISASFLLTGVSYVEPEGQAAPATAPVSTRPPSPTPFAPAIAVPAPEPAGGVLVTEPVSPKIPANSVTVPYEKEGRTRFVTPDEIAAVRAEGHYTILYSDAGKLFCPWSISEAESRLGPITFIRAHRSYLINPARVTEFRRTKDNGACFFAGIESLPKVPVSRSRLAEVRAALGA
ncbi:MAG: MHYT domain-containing protein [Pseudomonadota bacterium]